MADIQHRVDERIAHQAADQADNAIGASSTRVVGYSINARGTRRFHWYIVHRLHEIVDAEGDGGDEDDAEEFEAGEHSWPTAGIGYEKPSSRTRRRTTLDALDRQARGPNRFDPQAMIMSDRDRDQAGLDFHCSIYSRRTQLARMMAKHTTSPLRRSHVHLERRPHRDKRYRHASERSEQRGARGNFSNSRRNESTDHQDKALEEQPRPGRRYQPFIGVAGLES